MTPQARLKISTIFFSLKISTILKRPTRVVAGRHTGVLARRPPPGGNRMLEMTNENFARLLRGLTIAVGNRRNRILLYQFLAAEIRALHCSYGVGDDES